MQLIAPMFQEKIAAVRRGLRWLLAFAVVPLLLTGCAPFIKVGKPRTISVTLPCDVKKTDPPVRLAIEVGQFENFERGRKNKGGSTIIELNPADASKFKLSTNPLVISKGKGGSFDFTWLDEGYRGQGIILLLTETGKAKGHKPYLGTVSLVVEPEPCPEDGAPPVRSLRGRGSHIGTK